jgi:hypothetical protein
VTGTAGEFESVGFAILFGVEQVRAGGYISVSDLGNMRTRPGYREINLPLAAETEVNLVGGFGVATSGGRWTGRHDGKVCVARRRL